MSSSEVPASAPAGSGIPSLVRIARARGVELSPESIRRDHGAVGELTPDAMMALAKACRLETKRIKLRFEQLADLGTAFPVLLRTREEQWLVVEGFTRDDDTAAAMVVDLGADDPRPVAVDEFRLKTVWDGDCLLVKRGLESPEDKQPFGFLWLVRELVRERRIFRDVGIATLVASVFALAPPLFYGAIVDKVLVHQRLSTLNALLIVIAGVLMFDTAFGYVRRRLVTIGAARLDARLHVWIFDRLIGLPIDVFERTPTGIVVYKLNEIRRVRNFLTGQLFGTLLDSSTLLVLIPTLFLLNATLAWLVLGLALTMALVVIVYMGPMRRAYGRVVQAEHRKNALLIETVHGIRSVKALALEGYKRREWDQRVAEAVRAQTNLQHLANQPQTILHPIERLVYAGSLGAGAYLALTDMSAINPGTLVTFTMIATRAAQPFVQLAGLLQQFQEIRGAIDQLKSIVDLPPERQRRDGVRPPIRGAVVFDEVSFAYQGSPTPALDQVSFRIPQGSLVGVMGRSGSGKTTITRLLQGLHSDYRGLIKLDGIELREMELGHLRSSIGIVLQDNFLFQGTIRDNILAGRHELGLERVIHAARLAGAEEFIERLPRGFDTMIEEGSANLSGGQRQRIAIARALVADPPILILDEATSALDPESEAIVNTNLRRIAHGRTMIIVSHRLTSLVDCDQIIVLERGRLHDSGNHEELLERSDIYRHLWQQQSRQPISEKRHARPTVGQTA